MNKRTLVFLLFSPLLAAAPAVAGDVGVNVNVNLGAPAPVPIIVSEPPLFLVPRALGFQVAVGIDFDMFHIDGRYYTCRDHVWYVGHRYNGPWQVVRHDHLPPGLRKHRLASIRQYRDEEYRHYHQDRERYHGSSYRPEGEGEHHHGNGKAKGRYKHGD